MTTYIREDNILSEGCYLTSPLSVSNDFQLSLDKIFIDILTRPNSSSNAAPNLRLGWAVNEEYIMKLFYPLIVEEKRYIFGKMFTDTREAGFGIGCYHLRQVRR